MSQPPPTPVASGRTLESVLAEWLADSPTGPPRIYQDSSGRWWHYAHVARIETDPATGRRAFNVYLRGMARDCDGKPRERLMYFLDEADL